MPGLVNSDEAICELARSFILHAATLRERTLSPNEGRNLSEKSLAPPAAKADGGEGVIGEHPTSNIEHPTSKFRLRRSAAVSALDVRCWMLDVGCWMLDVFLLDVLNLFLRFALASFPRQELACIQMVNAVNFAADA